MKRAAIFSTCQKYRYVLSRSWEETLPKLLLIGLNPSTADATQDDPTIRRCIGFAQRWGFGSVYICNLFAFRATHPKDLKAALVPIGTLNDFYLNQYHKSCDQTVVAWGNDGEHLDRNLHVLQLIDRPYCLNINKNGQPAHPLYQKWKTTLKPYSLKEK